MLRVLKKVKAEITGKGHEFEIKAYQVRKQSVHTALTWLGARNTEYTNIGIDMAALDWMKGDEDTLEGFLIETEDLETTAHETAQNCDMGPAPNQARPPANGDFVQTFGYVGEGGEKTDEEIRDSLRKSVKKVNNKKMLSTDWPSQSATAFDEFCDKRRFVCAFHWLFPGGVGDPKDYPGF